MSSYEKIEVDFVARTIENIKCVKRSKIKGLYDVTFLINQCYGLLIFPQQKLDRTLKGISKEFSDYGLTSDVMEVNPEFSIEKTFDNFVASMRNGLSHGQIEAFSIEGSENIGKIEIKDYKIQSKKEEKQGRCINLAGQPWEDGCHTKITLTIEQLRTFVEKFSQEYLKCKGENAS